MIGLSFSDTRFFISQRAACNSANICTNFVRAGRPCASSACPFEGNVVLPIYRSKPICRAFSMNLQRQTRQYEQQLHGSVKPFLLSRVRFAAMVLPFMRCEYFARVIGAAVTACMQALVATNVMPGAITVKHENTLGSRFTFVHRWHVTKYSLHITWSLLSNLTQNTTNRTEILSYLKIISITTKWKKQLHEYLKNKKNILDEF